MVGWAIPLAIAAAAAWAVGMTLAKPALRHIDLLSYMLRSWSVVAFLAFVLGWVNGELFLPDIRLIALAAGAGLLDAVIGGLLYMTAMERMTAYQATTLASTAPLWGVLCAILFLGDPPQCSVILAAVVVVVGSFLLIGGRHSSSRADLRGSVLALSTGVLWGVAETVPSKLALDGGLSPAMLLLIFSLTAAGGAALLMPLLRKKIPRRIDRRGVLLAVLSGAAGGGLGWVLWLSSLRLASASVISPVRGSTLLFCFIYSVAFLRERPSRLAVVGAGLVLMGVVLVSLVG